MARFYEYTPVTGSVAYDEAVGKTATAAWRGSGAQVSLRHVCELVHFGGIKGAAGKLNS
jgi:hypothetical protein